MPFQKRKEMRSVSPSSDLSGLERGGNAVALRKIKKVHFCQVRHLISASLLRGSCRL